MKICLLTNLHTTFEVNRRICNAEESNLGRHRSRILVVEPWNENDQNFQKRVKGE